MPLFFTFARLFFKILYLHLTISLDYIILSVIYFYEKIFLWLKILIFNIMKTISPRLRDLIVAVLTAIITFFCSCCSSVWIKGSDNNPVIEHTPSVSADSTTFVKFRFGNAKAV